MHRMKQKVKLSQFDELRARFREKRDAKKPFSAVGHIAIKEGRKRTPAKPKSTAMYVDGFFNADYKWRIV